MGIDRWNPGDRFSAAHLNQAVDAIKTVVERNPLIPPLKMGSVFEVRQAAIVNAGPGGAGDFADNRYWVKFVRPALALAMNDLLTFVEDIPMVSDTGYIEPYPLCVENLSERVAGTHTLPVDGSLIVNIYAVRTEDNVPFWVMQYGGSGGEDRTRMVVWRANLAGGGKYLGKIINYSAGDIAGSVNLSNTGDLGDVTTSKVGGFVGAATDCIVLNTAERGRATHIWDGWSQGGTKDLWLNGIKIGIQSADDGSTGILAGMEIIAINLTLPQAQTEGEMLILDADGAPWSVGQGKLEN